MTQVHLTKKSSNAKTGPIPVSTSSRETCPKTCPFNTETGGKGCYAAYGPTALHWKKVTSGERGTDWDSFLESIKALPEGQLWRHNQAGDLPHNDGEIDVRKLNGLVLANLGKKGFTYTHHKPTAKNLRVVEKANLCGMTINVSANSPKEAAKLAAKTKAPVVSVVPFDFWEKGNSITQDGKDFVRCPAEHIEQMSCAKCKACAVGNRKSIIGFTAHGTAKNKVNLIASDKT